MRCTCVVRVIVRHALDVDLATSVLTIAGSESVDVGDQKESRVGGRRASVLLNGSIACRTMRTLAALSGLPLLKGDRIIGLAHRKG
ncbi:MAG: hypothetical protein NDI90_01585 [Nitrospira sp. BO4]|jgi:hypothetical protein|nr:hypothetical protein [Nitrospira sp. BO4]